MQTTPNLQIKEIIEITDTEVIYTIFNGEVKSWVIPKGSTFDLTSIKVGGSYHVWSKNISKPGKRANYDWVEAKPVGSKTRLMHHIKAPSIQPEQSPTLTVREELEILLGAVADQKISEEVAALVKLLAIELLDDSNLFNYSK